MCQWWVGDESLNIDDHDASMMSRWWIGNESGDELVKINDESVISRWKLMMRRWVGAEMVMSRCLFRNSRISRYQGRIFPLTYYLNLPSPVTSTRTSVRLFIFWAVATLLREIPSIFPFFPFFEGISLNKVATAQNIKNRQNNFLGTLMRMIHAKFQTSMTMLRRVETFCVISQKKGFFPL